MERELKAKTILHYHKQKFATHWDANIYRGCGHKCRYCFAQYSHKYLEKNFFDDIFAKINASELLKKELGKKSWKGCPVNVCGVSDCYQPAERKYRIMPGVIKSFIETKNPLLITTKSTLILRDLDLLKELKKVAEVSILISVSTLDENIRRVTEPYAAPTIERIKMLKIFSDLGFNTGVLFMPIIPYITDGDENLDELFKLIKENNLGFVITGTLHLRGNTKKVFYTFLEKHFPGLLSKYKELYKGSVVSKKYSSELYRKIGLLRRRYKLLDRPKELKNKKEPQLKLFKLR